MPLLLGLIRELGIEAEAREVDTLDIFTDGKAWDEAKKCVRELQADLPGDTQDIVVYDGVDGCQVCT